VSEVPPPGRDPIPARDADSAAASTPAPAEPTAVAAPDAMPVERTRLEPAAEGLAPPPVSRRAWVIRNARAMFHLAIERSYTRVGLVGLAFTLVFGTIAGRLILGAAFPEADNGDRRIAAAATTAIRPDIVDRNGEILATDIRTVSIFAEPRNIYDKDEAVELLTAVLPQINATELRAKLSTKKGFVWVKREITPKQQAEVHRLGIPGIGFLPDHKRVYPNGVAAAHILGVTNLDNIGIAGIEKYIDNQGNKALNDFGLVAKQTDLAPIQLSIDLRAQFAVRDELAWGLEHFKAKAAAGMILDVQTGEVIALASLPDFDPNDPADALNPDRINRMNVGVYEMGSTFKAMTLAMALDSGKYNVNSTFDTRGGVLNWGRQKIHEYHGTNRVITMPEVFTHSSNIGSAKMALGIGVPGHKAFLKKMGLTDRMRTELPESAEPLVPPRWTEINTITIAFGHGLAVAPIQATAAVAAIANGGFLMTPTFLKTTPEAAMAKATRVLKPETSEAMRFIMRLNAVEGSAKKAAIPYYFVGGKTGTAEKVIHGRYVKNRLFTTFMAAAPMNNPKYLFVTIMDEPQGLPESGGYATAAWNSGVVTGRTIERVAPILGLPPQFDPPAKPFPLMVKLGAYHATQVDGR
jgi:cell division protein FtsI (penicillin-binding protein 3)